MREKELGWLVTANNKLWWAANPNPTDISLDTIALVCSRIPRYGGHYTRAVKHYSIAEHACLCYYLLYKEVQHATAELELAILLHDVHEIYSGFGDVCGNMKPWFGGLKAIEGGIDFCIAEKFGLDPNIFEDPILKRVDHKALLLEKEEIMPDVQAPWPEIEGFDHLSVISPWRLGLLQPEAELMFRFLLALTNSKRQWHEAETSYARSL